MKAALFAQPVKMTHADHKIPEDVEKPAKIIDIIQEPTAKMVTISPPMASIRNPLGREATLVTDNMMLTTPAMLFS